MEPVGYTWLAQHNHWRGAPLVHASYLGARQRYESRVQSEQVTEYFTASYHPGNAVLDHVEFALKYDGVNLDLLRKVFQALAPSEIAAYAATKPSSRFTRQIGYLYELLTGQTVTQQVPMAGTYVDLLDPQAYLTGKPVRNEKWRINDNLLGTARFCPLVRRIPEINAAMARDLRGTLDAFQNDLPPELFRRAVDYLYVKETKSSYDIEHEKPTPDREARFVATLREAGRDGDIVAFSEPRLTALQNMIVEERFAQAGFRTWQNYVGENLPGRAPRVHYVCPPGPYVASLMEGLAMCAGKSVGAHPVARAAILAFGFVFIHPFEDGNGRIHRFLIHDTLSRAGTVPAGMILPVSAHMLRYAHEYDGVLEQYSRPLLDLAEHVLSDADELTVTNPDAVEGYYRYPDLTAQVAYLYRAVEKTIENELVAEVRFLQQYDLARERVREIADLPDRQLDLLLKVFHQNDGRISTAKRHHFDKLDDAEIARMESAYREVFAPRAVQPPRVQDTNVNAPAAPGVESHSR